ncbi:helix-turn-helix domain-containing protein [Streptomyces sp. NPDC004008]
MPSDLIGSHRAAEILHVTPITVRRMIERGELTGYRVTSGRTKVSESEVRAHIKVTAPTSVEVDAYIDRLVQAAPAPTPEQREKLRAWLAPAPAQSEAA